MDITVVDRVTPLSSGVQLAVMCVIIGGIPLALLAVALRSQNNRHPLFQFALIFQSASVVVSTFALAVLVVFATAANVGWWTFVAESWRVTAVLAVSIGSGLYALPVWWRMHNAPRGGPM